MPIFDCSLNRELTPVEEAARRANETRGNRPPDVVTRFQFKSAIRASGRAADLATHIAGLSAPQREEWTDRRFFRRDSAIVAAAAAALGVNSNQVDALFRSAAEIED